MDKLFFVVDFGVLFYSFFFAANHKPATGKGREVGGGSIL